MKGGCGSLEKSGQFVDLMRSFGRSHSQHPFDSDIGTYFRHPLKFKIRIMNFGGQMRS